METFLYRISKNTSEKKTCLGESVNKGKIVTKIYFQIMLNEALESCKKS